VAILAVQFGDTTFREHPMQRFEVKARRLFAACMLGILLFNYPLLALFNVTATAFGFPVLYLYIFGAWGLLIACMAYAVETEK
jgi:hypothetical protein